MILGMLLLTELVMCGKYLFVVLAVLIFACDSNFFPVGLYDYQVERLLSNDSSKTWVQQRSVESCQDSLLLLFNFVSSAEDDSVSIFEIVGGISCDPDTSFIGNADASSFSDALLFTDTLNFSDGNFWILRSLTAKRLVVFDDNKELFYLSE